MIKKWYIDLNNKKRFLVATHRGIAIILIVNVVLIFGVKRYCKTLLFSVIDMMLSTATTDGLSVEFNQGCGGCRLGCDMDFKYSAYVSFRLRTSVKYSCKLQRPPR